MIVHTRVESSHLAGNLLEDPSERDLFVYLPPGYDESDRRYPTGYLLQAYGETAAEMVTPPTDGTRWRPPIEDIIDPVFRRLGMPPMIVAIPDGWSRWGCGQWVDSPVTGNFEQYLLHDIVPAVDAAYRTIPSARSRGVFGFSSGGFGAWNVASRNPDVFGALAMLSGDSFLDMTHKFMPYKYFDSIWPDAPDGPIEGNVWSQLVYDYSATYSPNPDRPPFYVDLPVAWPSGELIQEVWDRWLAFDPVVNVHDRLDNLRKLSGIMLDAGFNDDYNLHWGHRLLNHHLNEAGIAHEFTENPGNHGGRANERYQVALKWLSQVLAEGGSPLSLDHGHVRDFARTYTEAWCNHDPAKVAGHYTPGGTIAINGGEPTEITEVARSFMDAFPDIQVFMDDLVFKNEAVEYHWTFTGTNTGPGGTGKGVRIKGFEEWTFGDNGLVAASLGHYDQAEYDRQLEHGAPEPG